MTRSSLFGSRDKEEGAGAGGGPISAFLDQGTEFEGRLSFKDSVRIDGTFRGEISSEGCLVVGPSAQIEATIHARTVLVSGHVHGDIHTSEKLALDGTGRVDGDVETPALVVSEGAVLNGRIAMGARAARSEPRLQAVAGGAQGR